jgi:hypothetical protein
MLILPEWALLVAQIFIVVWYSAINGSLSHNIRFRFQGNLITYLAQLHMRTYVQCVCSKFLNLWYIHHWILSSYSSHCLLGCATI